MLSCVPSFSTPAIGVGLIGCCQTRGHQDRCSQMHFHQIGMEQTTLQKLLTELFQGLREEALVTFRSVKRNQMWPSRTIC